MKRLFLMFLDHTQRRTTVGKTVLDEWSARLRDLYLTTLNTHNRKTFMHPVRFEPTISAGERPQTYALDRAATETDHGSIMYTLKSTKFTLKHLKTLKICPYMFQSVFRPSSRGSWTVLYAVTNLRSVDVHIRPHTAQIYNKRTSTDLSVVTA